MNLKKLLMDLGNMLVQKHGFDPATVPPPVGFQAEGRKPSTWPIKQFTDWLNECRQAQQVLADVGVEWPTAQNPHPKVEPQWLGCWVMAGPEGELMQWGKDGDTVEPYTDYKMAWAQAKFLAGSKVGLVAPYYILNVYSNGQVRLDEYGKDLTPPEHTSLPECAECSEKLGSMHHPECGKRVIGCPLVVADDCSPDTQ
jgi:hypothetical protein